MKVHFMRHGTAVEPSDWKGSEPERPLTDEGATGIKLAGRRLSVLGISFEAILTSPYARAAATARIIADALSGAPAPERDDRLSPGFGYVECLSIIQERRACASLLLLGHEPDFSETISVLTGGSSLEMKKGALARLDIDPGSAQGRLIFLIPPRFFA
jgi:phosphohistidine phosphatase